MQIKSIRTSLVVWTAIVFMLSGWANTASAQCTGGVNAGALSPTSVFQTVTGVSDNDYFTFPATAGNTYIFSYCQGGGTVTWDTELTLLDNSGTPLLYNDFACGPNSRSEITWVATGTGTFRILTTTWPCFSFGFTNATLAYREIAPVGAGATCASPSVIASLPFTHNNASTCGAGDDYNSTHACSSTFMNGEDFVYEYVASGPECIDLTLSNSNGSHGMFVLDGCPDVGGTSCIASVNSSGGNSISGVSLPAAGTYYIVISSQDPPSSCIDYDLTIENCPTGESCANPRVVSGIPYSVNGLSTCGFSDDYSSADACGSSYMNGDDFVFEYTAANAQCIDVFLSNTSNFTGVFVLDGCPDNGGTSCIASAEAPLGNPNVTGVNLPAAGTYYIVVSTSPSPQCTGFDVLIDTCGPPVPCGLNPAATDSCHIATNINGYPQFCGRTNPAIYNPTNPGNLNSVFCGVIDNNHWYYFTADSTTAVFNFTVGPCNLGLGIQAMVFSTSNCNTFTGVSNCLNPGAMANGTVTATGLTVGQDYYLMVDGNASDDCEYTVTYNGGPLPVAWGGIGADWVEGELKIDWQTLSEQNNVGFFIEKGFPSDQGEPGAMAWEQVGQIAGLGDARQLQEYSWVMRNALPDQEHFFRIRQMDADGFSTYSQILSVAPATEEMAWINVFPVPATHFATVRYHFPGREEVVVEVLDQAGRMLQKVNPPAGGAEDSELQLDLRDIPAGLYFVRVRSGAKMMIQRLLVSDQ